MIRLSLALITVFLALVPSPASADLDLSTADWTVTALDTLRARADFLRGSGDLAAGRAAAMDVLRQSPGDGFALRVLALVVRESGELSETAAALDGGALPGALATLDPAAADLSFFRGLLEFYRGRYRTAAGHFREAADARPQWGWPQFYLARVEERLLHPRAQCHARLQTALADPSVAPVVLDFIASELFDHSLAAHAPAARAVLTRMPPVPWLRDEAMTRDTAHTLREQPAPTPEQAAEQWRSWRASCPSNLADYGEYLLSLLTVSMSPGEYEEFRTLVSAGGVEANILELQRADRLASQSRLTEASAVLDAIGDSAMTALEVRQHYALVHGSAEAVRLWSERALNESVDYSIVSAVDGAAERLRSAALDSLAKAARREAPLIDMQLRLDRLLESDPVSAAALLDSLDQAGAESSLLFYYRLSSMERLGDTLLTQEKIAIYPRSLRHGYFLTAADGASSRGDRTRALKLIGSAIALYPESPHHLERCLFPVARTGDRQLTGKLVDALLSSCPGCAHTIQPCSFTLLWLNRPAEALRIIRDIVGDPTLSPSLCAGLAVQAQQLGAPGLADTLLATAARELPDSPSIRGARARILAERGETGPAREILQQLVAEFPGDQAYRSSLLSAGGSAQDSHGQDTEDDASAFLVFGHDLDSTDRLLGLAAKADTMQGVSAVYLLRQVSIASHGAGRAMKRVHEAILIRSENALDVFQPYMISFDASNPVPRIRRARVVRRDGSVVEVPRADIRITSDPDEETDLDDSRALAVPFPGLGVGGIIDLVYDTEIIGWYNNGWSTRYLFAGAFPVLESVVELASPARLGVMFQASDGTPGPIERSSGDQIVRTWKMADLEAVTLESFAPNIFESYPWVGISTHTSVEDGLKLYRDDFWNLIEDSPRIRHLADSLTAGLKGDRKKAEAIFRHVVESVRYVAIELGRGRIVPSMPTEILDRGYGDCKDMTALLVSLFEAAGIGAEPVLVSDKTGPAAVEGLPEPYMYDHVVVHLPSVDDLILDATSADPCMEPLPIGLAGTAGTALPRNGRIRRIELPAGDPRDHGYSFEADLLPGPGNRARIEVTCRYHGFLAGQVRESLAQPDSTARVGFIKERLAYGLWNTCILNDWDVVENTCDGAVLHAVFEDTSWTQGTENSVGFSWRTEIADPVIFYPNPKKRKHDFLMPFPFADEAVIRLHQTPEWKIEQALPVNVRGEGYRGAIRSEHKTEGSDSWLEIRQTFDTDRPRFAVEEYDRFWHDWIRFLAGLSQTYRYRRILNDEEVRKIEDYLRQNPADAGFALQSALKILGSDVGGEGESGRERRAAAAMILEPLSGTPETGAWPSVILAGIAARDGRYFRADSLITIAMGIAPGDVFVQAIAAGIKTELNKSDEVIDIYRSMLLRSGGEEIELALISLLHEMQRFDELKVASDRYFLLHAGSDSLPVIQARLQGALKANRCDEADSIFATIRRRLSPEQQRLFESAIHLACDRFEEGIEVLEQIWEEDPFDPIICNNLAWCHALLGRNLERAEELTEIAILLSSDKVASRNTLGAIYARRGEWKRAREIFSDLSLGDDRPGHRATNDFFVGLCDYQLGKREEALRVWRRILTVEGAYDARRWAGSAIALHEAGEPVTRSVFTENPEGEE
jgi:tetratricopeptide (TPR) repeat protein